MKNFLLLVCLSLRTFAAAPVAETWNFNSLESIGGHPVTLMGNPKVVPTPDGDAVAFDGDGDRLLVGNDPLGDAKAFTVEMVFNPGSSSAATTAPRFMHIQNPANSSTGLMMELRVNDKGGWAFDGGLTTDMGARILFDASKTHPMNQWAHVAVSFDGTVFKTFVNGVEELKGNAPYKTVVVDAGAVVSVGARMNKIYWLLGMVRTMRITRAALDPKDFMSIHGAVSIKPLRADTPFRGGLRIFTLAGRSVSSRRPAPSPLISVPVSR
jgi:hypothetical protein